MPRRNSTQYDTKSPPELRNSPIPPDLKQTSAPRTESHLTYRQSSENQTKLSNQPQGGTDNHILSFLAKQKPTNTTTTSGRRTTSNGRKTAKKSN
ncbi:hypothetical protein P8452_13435 [Trifolium repens]|nr:hypothetical protein P8452_13435 [Trifolium repens]